MIRHRPCSRAFRHDPASRRGPVLPLEPLPPRASSCHPPLPIRLLAMLAVSFGGGEVDGAGVSSLDRLERCRVVGLNLLITLPEIGLGQVTNDASSTSPVVEAVEQAS